MKDSVYDYIIHLFDENQMQDSVYDYENQGWVVDGIIESCAHPDSMQCSCYGKRHAGQRPENVERLEKRYIP